MSFIPLSSPLLLLRPPSAAPLPRADQAYSHVFFSTFLPSQPTFPEFTLLHLLTGALVLSPSSLDAFPLLKGWFAKLNGREKIKTYLESGRKPKMLNDCQAGQEKVCE